MMEKATSMLQEQMDRLMSKLKEMNPWSEDEPPAEEPKPEPARRKPNWPNGIGSLQKLLDLVGIFIEHEYIDRVVGGMPRHTLASRLMEPLALAQRCVEIKYLDWPARQYEVMGLDEVFNALQTLPPKKHEEEDHRLWKDLANERTPNWGEDEMLEARKMLWNARVFVADLMSEKENSK